MGAIYLGKKLGVDGFEKEVVLKQLLPEFTREPKFIDMFLREARLSASLDHANIVRTVDLVNAGEDYFMVMEYVRGGDLRTLMRRARRRHMKFSPSAGVFIAHEILEALAYAHGKAGHDGRNINLIHRDVSPSNILVSGAGEVKLTDFGIAKASTHRSVFHKVKGKVGYMSPEQARGEPVDRRSDLFSLGVVLYEVLVGERLFVGDLLTAASMVYAQKVTPPSQKRPDVPPELDAVIVKSLSLDPRQRFQSAQEFQEALNRAASRNRLIAGASEMATHLRSVCGDDPSSWLKLEQLGHDESQAIAHGTAVLSTVDDGADPFDDSEPHPMHLPVSAFAKKELTSVIALRGDDIELIGDDDDDFDSPLSSSLPLIPLAPKRSEPIQVGAATPGAGTPTPTPTGKFTRENEVAVPTFEGEESQASRAATIIRTNEGRFEADEPASARRRSPTGEQTLVREPGSTSSAQRLQVTSTERPRGMGGPDRSDRGDRPGDRSAPKLRPVSHSQPQAQAQQPVASPPRSEAKPQARPEARPGARVDTWNEPTRIPDANLASTRKNPAFDPPLGGFESTDSVRRVAARGKRPRRLLPIVIFLILIGLGVALGVAFSGPELDVVDPVLPGQSATQPGAQAPARPGEAPSAPSVQSPR